MAEQLLRIDYHMASLQGIKWTPHQKHPTIKAVRLQANIRQRLETWEVVHLTEATKLATHPLI